MSPLTVSGRQFGFLHEAANNQGGEAKVRLQSDIAGESNVTLITPAFQLAGKHVPLCDYTFVQGCKIIIVSCYYQVVKNP